MIYGRCIYTFLLLCVMHRVYVPEINDNEIYLSAEESKHLIKSLRLKVNDFVELTDGKGMLATSKIESIDKNTVKLSVAEKINIPALYPHLHLAVALTKNPDRFEWFIEKATEIGVNEITPLVCERSERFKVNTERLNRIMVSAIKQSQNAYLPKLNNCSGLPDLVNTAGIYGQKFIAHCYQAENKYFITTFKKALSTIILIGPEGDFSPKEIALAASHNFTAISLGNQRLRTETAALYSCAVFRALQN